MADFSQNCATDIVTSRTKSGNGQFATTYIVMGVDLGVAGAENRRLSISPRLLNRVSTGLAYSRVEQRGGMQTRFDESRVSIHVGKTGAQWYDRTPSHDPFIVPWREFHVAVTNASPDIIDPLMPRLSPPNW